MAMLNLRYIFASFAVAAVISIHATSILPLFPSASINSLAAIKSTVIRVCLTAIASELIKWAVLKWWKRKGTKGAVYGLQHGRLHLQAQTAMWMNMGYWKHATVSTTMGDACRDLLSAVLSQAGFSQELDKAEEETGIRRTKCLIDLGVGCGDQSIYLLSKLPVRQSDAVWWDARKHCIKFDHYIGITNDVTQAQYASERLAELQSTWHEMEKPDAEGTESSNPLLFCADAARPEIWNQQLQASIQRSHAKTQERWVLALDTAYHFAPSRWHLIKHIHQNFKASFMAFDLCISPTATNSQRLMLRGLTTIMGAPWHNFTTPEEYCAKFVQAGYHTDDITIKDVSEHVFTPLADYLDGQDRRLAALGLSIGAFGVAKKMFAWWGRTGVVRGIVVVARFDEGKSHELV